MYRWRNVEDEEVADKLGVKADDAGFRRLVQSIPEMLLLLLVWHKQEKRPTCCITIDGLASQLCYYRPFVFMAIMLTMMMQTDGQLAKNERTVTKSSLRHQFLLAS